MLNWTRGFCHSQLCVQNCQLTPCGHFCDSRGFLQNKTVIYFFLRFRQAPELFLCLLNTLAGCATLACMGKKTKNT